jgi:hypothetical protein
MFNLAKWSTATVRFHGTKLTVASQEAKAVKAIAKTLFKMTPADAPDREAGAWALKLAVETVYELKRQANGLYPEIPSDSAASDVQNIV